MPEHPSRKACGYKNTNLARLPPEVLQRLQLRPVRLPILKELEFPGKAIAYLYFLESGVASMTTTFSDGTQVEVGLLGRESMLGISALMGTKRSLNRLYIQLSGEGHMSPTAAARAEFQRGGVFQELALRSVQAQLLQTAQTAGCNMKHDILQRLARWLLLCADRSDQASFAVSQDFIATMLGVRRMGASVAIGQLKRLALIEHQRGTIQILDRERLEAKACECYQVLKQHLSDQSEFD